MKFLLPPNRKAPSEFSFEFKVHWEKDLVSYSLGSMVKIHQFMPVALVYNIHAQILPCFTIPLTSGQLGRDESKVLLIAMAEYLLGARSPP